MPARLYFVPLAQAFHALHDQGLASAPLWDSETASVPGMISASDFIQVRFLVGKVCEWTRLLMHVPVWPDGAWYSARNGVCADDPDQLHGLVPA